MTAISTSLARTDATPFEILLLRAASALDAFVDVRLQRRGSVVHRCVAETADAVSAARDAAQARGAIGILPR